MVSHRSFKSDLDTIIRYSEVPVSSEDDLYYADLERQILELTADDDDHDEEDSQSKPVNIGPSRRASNEGSCLTWADFPRLENYGNKNVMPSWFGRSDQMIQSNGTGVFIPHVTQSQTRISSGRISNNYRRRLYRQTTKNNNQRVYNVA